MTQRQIFGCFCILLGGAMVGIVGGILLGQYRSAEAAGDRADALLAVVETARRSDTSGTDLNISKNQGRDGYEPTVLSESVDGCDCIGTLSFPSLDLVLPVFWDCTETLLKTAPCRQHGSAETHDFVIAGHNYRRHFKRLRELALGERLYFTAIDRKEYQYTVEAFETLLPTDWDRLLSGDWDLSLYTCTSGGEKRLVVRCILDS